MELRSDFVNISSTTRQNLNLENKKIFLIRLPADANIKVLNEMKLDMSKSKNNNNILKHNSSNQKDNSFAVSVNMSSNCSEMNNIRALSSTDENIISTIPLTGCITISHKPNTSTLLNHSLSIDNNVLNDIIVQDYNKVNQIPGLELKSLPYGSLTNLKEVHKKVLQTEVRKNANTQNLSKRNKKAHEKKDSNKNNEENVDKNGDEFVVENIETMDKKKLKKNKK